MQELSNHFYSNYVRISEENIELARNGFPYKRIEYPEIKNIGFTRGPLIRNSIWIRLISIIIIFLSTYVMVRNFSFVDFINKNGLVVSLLLIWRLWPIFMIVALLFVLYQSFKKTTIMVIRLKSEEHIVRLKEFEKGDIIHSLHVLLRRKLGSKVQNLPIR